VAFAVVHEEIRRCDRCGRSGRGRIHDVYFAADVPGPLYGMGKRRKYRAACVRVLICNRCRARALWFELLIGPFFGGLLSRDSGFGWVATIAAIVLVTGLVGTLSWFGRLADKGIEHAVFARHCDRVASAIGKSPSALLFSF
jgi:hypothetical protein